MITHYQPVFEDRLTCRGWADDHVGAVTWAERQPYCRWPAWTDDNGLGIAFGYPPIGWQRLVGDLEPEAAATPLARTLWSDPTAAIKLTPPFSAALVDRSSGRLMVVNDALGFARLYEAHAPGIRVWSNRLGALALFAGLPPRLDRQGWRVFAGSGWFMGETTPLEGMRAMPAASVAFVDPKRSRRWFRAGGTSRTKDTAQTGGVPRALVAPRGRPPDLQAIVAEMQQFASVAETLWPDPPLIHLSGGRDSRVVAGAALTAGIRAVFQTNATYAGEAEVARDLIARSGHTVDHRFVELGDVSITADLRDRVVALHARYDGLASPGNLRGNLAPPLKAYKRATLNGSGGEIAHGAFYRANPEYARQIGPLKRLELLYRYHGGVPEVVHRAVSDQVARVLHAGEKRGIRGLSLLDYFYLADRLPRWVDTAFQIGNLSPFLTPAFVRGAFDLSPEERMRDVLHRDLVAQFIPAWAEIPFYTASPEEEARITRRRLWETNDAAVFEQLLADPSEWSDVFDVKAVRTMWREVTEGDGPYWHESVFERVAWRAFYAEHIAALQDAAVR